MNIPKDQFYELHGATPPDVLEHLASELPDIPDIDLAEYAGVIRILHDTKDYSFSKIVEFLRENGIESNRSAVYRVYKESRIPPEEEDPLVDDDTGEIVEK